MLTYLTCWVAGGVVGTAAALLVLRHRGTLTWRAATVLPVAAIGCLYGAKLQYRLRYFPLLDAISISPSELVSPGYHIPLGLVCGLLAGVVASLVLRVSLLQVADALAMSGAVMMPIGRVGCLLSGCCTGTICPFWMRGVCFSYPPGTESYQAQLAQGLISPSSALSLPAHPLPIYFGLLGIGLAASYLVQLRRGTPPGTLVAVGLLVYPVGQLVLEHLRAVGVGPQIVMTSVLSGMIVLDTLCVALWIATRRRGAGRLPSAARSVRATAG